MLDNCTGVVVVNTNDIGGINSNKYHNKGQREHVFLPKFDDIHRIYVTVNLRNQIFPGIPREYQ